MDIITAEHTLLLAFSLGLLHALDADHVMAVSALTAKRPTMKSCLHFCSHWATGHGLALAVIAAAVFLFGAAIPETLSAVAESMVGVVLITLGAYTLWEIYRKGLDLSFHHHEPDIHHAHWHDQQHKMKQDHSAMLVGILHGTAGSAPLLLLLPLSQMGSAANAFSYVVLFALGVIVAMVIFGGLLAQSYKKLARFGNKVIGTIRGLVALSSVGLGSHLLIGLL